MMSLPGIVLVGEGHCANTLTDKVDRERHLKESLHWTWMEGWLLKSVKPQIHLILNQKWIIY